MMLDFTLTQPFRIDEVFRVLRFFFWKDKRFFREQSKNRMCR